MTITKAKEKIGSGFVALIASLMLLQVVTAAFALSGNRDISWLGGAQICSTAKVDKSSGEGPIRSPVHHSGICCVLHQTAAISSAFERILVAIVDIHERVDNSIEIGIDIKRSASISEAPNAPRAPPPSQV